jgi:hypothetical protein
LQELGALQPQLPLASRVRRGLGRLPLARRLDRLELSDDQLGARSMPAGSRAPVRRLLWSVNGERLGLRPSSLDEVLDELVASQLWRYRDLLGIHDRAVDGGAAPSPVLAQLGSLFRRRMVENLAGIAVQVTEHSPRMLLADLGRMVVADG